MTARKPKYSQNLRIRHTMQRVRSTLDALCKRKWFCCARKRRQEHAGLECRAQAVRERLLGRQAHQWRLRGRLERRAGTHRARTRLPAGRRRLDLWPRTLVHPLCILDCATALQNLRSLSHICNALHTTGSVISALYSSLLQEQLGWSGLPLRVLCDTRAVHIHLIRIAPCDHWLRVLWLLHALKQAQIVKETH